MIRLTLALLLLVAAQPAVFGKQTRRSAHSKQVNAKQRADANSKTKIRRNSSVTFQSGLSLPAAKNQGSKAHWDPNRSGNLLLFTGGKYKDKKLAPNFTVSEYSKGGDVARIDPKHVDCLQELRDSVGRPVVINSGYRSFDHNNQIYWARNEKPTRSQHISGRAADIKIGNMTGFEIAQAAIDACGPNISIGVGLHYAHIDVRGHFKVWKYTGVPVQQVAALTRYRDEAYLAQKRRARRALERSISKRGDASRIRSTSKSD
jgi:uncharacterized protein YcbK (DUF882 family)